MTLTKITHDIQRKEEYTAWRELVMNRDNPDFIYPTVTEQLLYWDILIPIIELNEESRQITFSVCTNSGAELSDARIMKMGIILGGALDL